MTALLHTGGFADLTEFDAPLAICNLVDMESFCTPALKMGGRTQSTPVRTVDVNGQKQQSKNIYSVAESIFHTLSREWIDGLTCSSLMGGKETIRPVLHDSRKHVKPAGSSYTCLLSEGRRSFYRHTKELTGASTVTKKNNDTTPVLPSGSKPCYAVWGNHDGTPFGRPPLDVLTDDEDGSLEKTIWEADEARGLLLTVEPLFKLTSGAFMGASVTVIICVFRVDPIGNELELSIRSHLFYDQDLYPSMSVEMMNKVLPKNHDLLRRALEGFTANCAQLLHVQVEGYRKRARERERKKQAVRPTRQKR